MFANLFFPKLKLISVTGIFILIDVIVYAILLFDTGFNEE